MKIFLALLSFHSLLYAGDSFDTIPFHELRQQLQEADKIGSLTESESLKLPELKGHEDQACLIVKTDEGNFAKILVSWGFRKRPDGLTPVIVIDRFVTFDAARPGVTTSNGKNVMLFPGFRFDLDLGQVVPEGFGEDLLAAEQGTLKSTEQASLHAWKNVTETEPESRSELTGEWEVDADGRIAMLWDLNVDDTGKISGTAHSVDTEGQYTISGKVGPTDHQFKLHVEFANSTQTYSGHLWSKSKVRIAGEFEQANVKFGFIAKRKANPPK